MAIADLTKNARKERSYMQSSLSDIAKKFNIPVSTLRYYEKEGALPFMQRSAAGYFLIDRADLTALYLLQYLRDAGCSVKMITEIMKLVDAEKNREYDSTHSNHFFPEIIQLLTQHSDELLKQQQLLLWQTQVTNYLKWMFLRYLEAGTSIIDDIPYPGPLPPDLLKDMPHFDFEDLVKAYKEKYPSCCGKDPDSP